jgi:hypothetical protein
MDPKRPAGRWVRNREETFMRIIFALPVLALGACNFSNDANNDQMTLEYNQQRIEQGATDVENAAGDVARSVGNVASSAGSAIRNEVGDIDVDVNVSRNRSGNSH